MALCCGGWVVGHLRLEPVRTADLHWNSMPSLAQLRFLKGQSLYFQSQRRDR